MRRNIDNIAKIKHSTILGSISDTIFGKKGVGKRVGFNEFGNHGRGTGGQKIFGNIDGKGEIIGAVAVADNDEVICMTGQGKTLRVKASDISKQGRASSGTRVINIEDPDYVVGFDIGVPPSKS